MYQGIQPDAMGKLAHRHYFTYTEVVDQWSRLVSPHGDPFPKNEYQRTSLRQDFAKGGWVGNTTKQMQGFIADGYKSPAFDSALAIAPNRPKPSLIFADEGEELDFPSAWSGSDEPWMRWQDVPRKPGVALIVNMAFVNWTEARTIADYGAWVASILSGLELAGFDADVLLRIQGFESYSEDPTYEQTRGRMDVDVHVKKANELTNFQSFSAIFAPGGYRHLGFTALIAACEEKGIRIAHGLGSYDREAKGTAGWDVIYTPEQQCIEVCTDYMASVKEFPAVEMTTKLMDTGVI